MIFTLTISNAQTEQKKTVTKTTTKSTKTTATTTITDDDLKKYALTMDSVSVMQQTLTQIIAENVQQNTVMPVARYNELLKAGNDQAKLDAAQVTAEEKAFLSEIAALKTENLARINVAFQALAKEYVGLKTFNAIKKGLENDAALKARFEDINKQIANRTQGSTKDNGE
jgi:hypothetical protein